MNTDNIFADMNDIEIEETLELPILEDNEQTSTEIEIHDKLTTEESCITDIEDFENVVQINIIEENIGVDSAFPPLGGEGSGNVSSSNHTHRIENIIGLSGRLENIERPRQLRSDKDNIAHYYTWSDENPNSEDRTGYFVTFIDNNHIEISEDNVVGVTIHLNKTGFVGNYNPNPSRGLVCVSGIVPVRTLSNVKAGDKVIPDVDGRAKKSTNDYGYRVIEVYEELTERYAVITLVPETVSLVDFKEDVDTLNDRIDSVGRDIDNAITTANEALKKSLMGHIEQVGQQASSALDVANGAQNTATNAQNVAQGANTNSVLAKEMAQSAQTTVKNIKENVNESLTSAKDRIDELTKEIEPISTWESDKGKGATWFIDHIENDLATKIYVNDVKTEVDEAKTAIEVNARGVQSLALMERKYFTGPHSPSHGMSLAEAQETLKVGMVYVPTVDTVETAEGSIEAFDFHIKCSYIWNGVGWDEYPDTAKLSSSYTTGNGSAKYWYVDGQDVIEGDITYPADTLCKWVDDKWVVVASARDVSSPWVASRVYQTANSLESYIGTANGEFTEIKQSIEDVKSSISLMATSGDTAALIEAIANGEEVKINNSAIYNGASLIERIDMSKSPTGSEFYRAEPVWSEERQEWGFSDVSVNVPYDPCWTKFYTDDDTVDKTKYCKYGKRDKNNWVKFIYKYTNNFAGISQKVDANSSKLSLVVSQADGENVVNAASIVAAVNNAGSSVAISAGHIDLSGKVISLNAGGVTIDSTNFKVSAGGSITATDGTIGGWTIGTNSLHTSDNALYLGNTGITSEIGGVSRSGLVFKAGSNFGVSSNGTLYASGARINGNIDASSFSIDGVDLDDIFYPSRDGSLNVGDMVVESDGSTYLYAPIIIGGELRAVDDDSNLTVTADGIIYQKYYSSTNQLQTDWKIITQNNRVGFVSTAYSIALSSISSIYIEADDGIDLRTSNLMLNGEPISSIATFG